MTKKKVVDNDVWSTGDEIRFIKNTKPKGKTRLEFLLNYKEAVCNRTEWETMKKEQVIEVLDKEIQQEKGE